MPLIDGSEVPALSRSTQARAGHGQVAPEMGRRAGKGEANWLRKRETRAGAGLLLRAGQGCSSCGLILPNGSLLAAQEVGLASAGGLTNRAH
jgi:hypothetical protein